MNATWGTRREPYARLLKSENPSCANGCARQWLIITSDRKQASRVNGELVDYSDAACKYENNSQCQLTQLLHLFEHNATLHTFRNPTNTARSSLLK